MASSTQITAEPPAKKQKLLISSNKEAVEVDDIGLGGGGGDIQLNSSSCSSLKQQLNNCHTQTTTTTNTKVVDKNCSVNETTILKTNEHILLSHSATSKNNNNNVAAGNTVSNIASSAAVNTNESSTSSKRISNLKANKETSENGKSGEKNNQGNSNCGSISQQQQNNKNIKHNNDLLNNNCNYNNSNSTAKNNNNSAAATTMPTQMETSNSVPNSSSSSSGGGVAGSGNDIDESLYSRQLYVLGHDAMRRMANSDILVSGLGGLGLEIAKNVILGGVKSITLHDRQTCTIRDLSSQFYLSETDIGKNRAEVSCDQLSELNNYVRTKAYTGELTEDLLRQFRVVVLTASDSEEEHRIAKFAHENGIALIIADTRGLFAKVFCDFGENFTIFDSNGTQPISTMVASITRDEQGVITCLDEARHGFEDGDYVTFSEVSGMTELNGCAPIKINVLGPYTFSIGDTSSYGEYLSGGIATQVKMPKTINFKPLEVAEKEPEFLISDFSKFDHPNTLHVCFNALQAYHKATGSLPRPWNEEDAVKFLQLAKTLSQDLKDELVLLFAKICAGNTCPMDAAIGGFVAQEVLKACSGKFTPIYQWFYYDAIECLPKEGVAESDAQPLGTRYDAQIAIFGRNFQEKLSDAK